MKHFSLLLLVIGMVSCQGSFHKKTGIDRVVFVQNSSGGRGYDPAASWYTRQAYITTDSGEKKGYWGIDTVFLIHVKISDTLKNAAGKPILDTAHKIQQDIRIGEWPSKYVLIDRLPIPPPPSR